MDQRIVLSQRYYQQLYALQHYCSLVMTPCTDTCTCALDPHAQGSPYPDYYILHKEEESDNDYNTVLCIPQDHSQTDNGHEFTPGA